MPVAIILERTPHRLGVFSAIDTVRKARADGQTLEEENSGHFDMRSVVHHLLAVASPLFNGQALSGGTQSSLKTQLGGGLGKVRGAEKNQVSELLSFTHINPNNGPQCW